MSTSDDLIVGIDLGTTNSLVAYADERGPMVLRRNKDDSGLLPSVVSFDPSTHRMVVGDEAKLHAVERPLTTVYSIKRLMGKGFSDVTQEIRHLPYRVVRRPSREEGRDLPAVEINDRLYTPPEISAMILKTLKELAEVHFGRPVLKAVITVPAFFDDAQRQATRDAGRIAGLEVVRIINEPTAAALAYRLDQKKESTIAVYDLGGGTFDVSILRISDGVFEVLSTHGDTALGGDDFDREIIGVVRDEIEKQYHVRIESPATQQALRTLAEQLKIRLSHESEAKFEIDIGSDRRYERVIRREEFESLIRSWIDKTIDCCRAAIRDADLEIGSIDQVVMVGGSTRIPYVRRRVGEYFGRQPYTAWNPDEVVALGAAVQASILAGKTSQMLLLDVTPLSLGIETLGGAMSKLIMRNTRIPARATEMFTTFVDGQTSIRINVLQGERELAKDCRSLGVFELSGIPPMPGGIPKAEVTFLIDQNGILNVSAMEVRSQQAAGIQIIPTHGLTPVEVEAMVVESYAHAREDMTAHQMIDLRNQVTFETTKAQDMLDKVGHLLGESERRETETVIRTLRELAKTSSQPKEIQQARADFARKTVRLAEIAMTESLKTI